ncbi:MULTISPECIES: hypothetical protein [Prochlorococcus]|uniref:hypothetical protein n=1 Tax=Prochlorococcus TaxID=1218 RepID=UPI0007B3710E|nr:MULTISPECIES: hypothetical protein [Prochlorococcus]KZR68227.1 hypothetical protein PMIT1312_00187 [Prochlorococcus marinus str. MIT 1312]KZR84054.1 hypothetical protein PMIT1327_00219 [Prochlorococcus marinus str. MIT 1327]NMO83807.1 hypothetical protein [Prochlorococcus sp. P1344]NMP05001.1 hypothetical protein [Prochlorococcus sp. P1361]NMP12470.1 hypothetical protein [Prochlorococcus sp.P1363]
MDQPTLPNSNRFNPPQQANSPSQSNSPVKPNSRIKSSKGRRLSRSQENSDVLVSAVISSYLLTHLHQVLQRAEYGAAQDGREYQAKNFAQLRKVLCMDARSMKDASATGMTEVDVEQAA